MSREERYLERTFGRENHFKVPDGYFDTLTDRLMSKLPEHEVKVVRLQPSFRQRKRTAILAAASLLAAMFSLGVYLHTEDSEPHTQAVAATLQSADDSNLDVIADYAMMDNVAIYAYVSDN